MLESHRPNRCHSMVIVWVLVLCTSTCHSVLSEEIVSSTATTTIPNKAPYLVWEATLDAASACPSYDRGNSVVQASILNPPFHLVVYNVTNGRIRWSMTTTQDAVVASIPQTDSTGPNNDLVLLEYLGDTRDTLLLHNVFQNWAFQIDRAASAQSNPVLLMHNATQTWFCFTTFQPVSQSTCKFMDTAKGTDLFPPLSRFPAGFHLWQQTSSDDAAVLLLRDETGRQETQLFVIQSNSTSIALSQLDRLPYATELLCLSPDGEWLLSGFQIVYVYRRVRGTYVWYTTLFPPFYHTQQNIHPSTCTFSSRRLYLAWFLDQMNESQLFVWIYTLPLEPFDNTHRPIPVAAWTSRWQPNIMFPDKLTSLVIVAEHTTEHDAPPPTSVPNISAVLVGGSDGSMTLEDEKQKGAVIQFVLLNNTDLVLSQVLHVRGSILELYPTNSHGTNESVGIVFCAKRCHALEACAGGQLGRVELFVPPLL